MKNLKVGDEVYLREDSKWSDGSEKNPLGVKGVVADANGKTLPLHVDWVNEGCNSYREKDLIKVTQEKPVVVGFKIVKGDGQVLTGYCHPMRALETAISVAHESTPDWIHKNGKPKFRLVYKEK